MPAGRSVDEILEKCRKSGVYGRSPISINEKDALGDTPLHIAAAWGDPASVALLVRAGADVNAVGDRGRTPLFCTDRVEVATILVDAGADIRHRDDQGMTIKELANALERSDIARWLSTRR